MKSMCSFQMWTITSATSSTARQDPFQVFEGGNYDNITSTFRNLPVDIANEEMWTALLNAAKNDYIEICKVLLDAGANIEDSDV
ncbi:conserved hypothetical protein, partial [Trichinella spiralis]|uniref:hypothetical protein n=1 Tax=Trichinella spiralis TaxID=6334 RepID=UPI0001EFE07F